MVDAVRPARATLIGWLPWKVWLAVLPSLLTFNCAAPQAFQARIRRTSYNIPHIEARDVGSLGFGEGYAQAEDHLCSIADQVVRVRGERSRYFGPGGGNRHFYSDVAMKALGVHQRASEHLRSQSRQYRDWLAGFAAGYNHYLAATGKDAVPGWCTGEDWVVPISTQDLAAYLYMVTLTTTRFATVIGSAQPPPPEDGRNSLMRRRARSAGVSHPGRKRPIRPATVGPSAASVPKLVEVYSSPIPISRGLGPIGSGRSISPFAAPWMSTGQAS